MYVERERASSLFTRILSKRPGRNPGFERIE
jgi:hypothetical protein